MRIPRKTWPTFDRDAELDMQVGIMRTTLEAIVTRNDCWYEAGDRPHPCDCPRCAAERALVMANDWRYQGAHPDRLVTMSRERKIVEAWRNDVDDHRLAQILDEQTIPTPRDWYVATSVVQWLATNVGMEVLRIAGFTYTQWDADRAEREAAEAEKKKKKTP